MARTGHAGPIGGVWLKHGTAFAGVLVSMAGSGGYPPALVVAGVSLIGLALPVVLTTTAGALLPIATGSPLYGGAALPAAVLCIVAACGAFAYRRTAGAGPDKPSIGDDGEGQASTQPPAFVGRTPTDPPAGIPAHVQGSNIRPLTNNRPLAEWSALMSQVSHELRTPLNAVIGFSEVMDQQIYGPLGHAKYQEYAGHIRSSGSRLLKSTEDTLAMAALVANVEQAHEQRLALAGLFAEAVALSGRLFASRQLCIEIECASDVMVRSDPRGLRQALTNLIVAGSMLARADATIRVRATCRGGLARIEISVEPVIDTPIEPAGQDGGPELPIGIARLLLNLLGRDLAVSHDHAAGRWQALTSVPLCLQPGLFELDAA